MAKARHSASVLSVSCREKWNYNHRYGGDYTRGGYKAKVRQLYNDVIADFCAGQRPPAMFTYQTGGTYTIDTYELAIGMAQLDMATEGGNIWRLPVVSIPQ